MSEDKRERSLLPPAPSFSSFPTPSGSGSSSTASEAVRRSSSSKHHSSTDRKKRKHHHRSDHDEKSTKKRNTSPQIKQKDYHREKEKGKGKEEDGRKLYYNDYIGDSDNLRYQTNEHSKVPKFYRRGFGTILALNNGLRIYAKSEQQMFGMVIGPKASENTSRYTHTYSFKSAKRFIPSTKTKDSLQSNDSYISLGEPSKASKHSEQISGAYIISAKQSENNKGNQDKEDQHDEEEDEDDDQEEGGETATTFVLRQISEQETKCRQDPENADLWIKRIDLESDLVETYDEDFLKRNKRGALESKYKLYKTALKYPRNLKNNTLLRGYFETMIDLFPTEKVLEMYKTLLEDDPTNTSLWIMYTSFRQTNFTLFNLDSVLNTYQECLDTLRDRAIKAHSISQERIDIEQNMIYLFLRLCFMLDQAGYYERAIACFQAILELNFCLPSDLVPRPYLDGPLYSAMLSQLEKFWDSETPRIGEDNSCGWSNTDLQRRRQPAPTSTPFNQEVEMSKDGEEDKFLSWGNKERQILFPSDNFPKRMSNLDEYNNDDDPYKYVIFAEIKPFMFYLSNTQVKFQLIYAFLVFLGIPISPPGVSTETEFFADPFIDNQFCTNKSRREKFWPANKNNNNTKVSSFELVGGEPMESVRTSALKDPVNVPFNCTPTTSSSIFEPNNQLVHNKFQWFSVLNNLVLNKQHVSVAKNALQLLSHATNNNFLKLLLFSLDSQSQASENIPKKVLKTNRNQLVLWDGFARVQKFKHGILKSRDIYVNALSLRSTLKPSDLVDEHLMWRGLIELEWEQGHNNVALVLILAYSGVLPSDIPLSDLLDDNNVKQFKTPIRLIKAPKLLKSKIDESFLPKASMSQVVNRETAVYLLALFEYFRRNGDTEAASNIINEHIQRLQNPTNSNNGASCSPEELEEIMMLHCKILYIHMQTMSAYRPHELRDALESAITRFPRNTGFLSLYAYNEQRSKLHNRVRKLLNTAVLKRNVSTSTLWAFAVYVELHLDARKINVPYVRHLFESGVTAPSSRASWMLWSLYIEFEISQSEFNKAKSLVNRAITECPWVKDLYLVAFQEPLRGKYRKDELRNLQILLIEKGIRLSNDIGDEDDELEPEDEAEVEAEYDVE